MSQPQLQRLTQMINQIALNMSANGDPKMVGHQVAQHLEKFWSPPMKNLITEQPIDEQMTLSPIAQIAIDDLRRMQLAKRV
jgi:formate dehydrogenase subunit delta